MLPTAVESNHELVVVVKSHPKNIDKRDKIRKSWLRWCQGNREGLADGTYSCSVIFCVGVAADRTVNSLARMEAQERGDVLYLGDHIEDFGDPLSMKTLVMHNYALVEMNSPYILGTDDDEFWNIPNVFKLLRHLPTFGVFRGSIVKGRPVRSKEWGRRYFVAKERFSGNIHPAFPAGSGVLMSKDVVSMLMKRARLLRQHPVDDVNIGMLALGLTTGALTLRNEKRFGANPNDGDFLNAHLSSGEVRADGFTRYPGEEHDWVRLWHEGKVASNKALQVERESLLAASTVMWLRTLNLTSDNDLQQSSKSECGALALRVASPRQGEVLLLESVHFKYSLHYAATGKPASLRGGYFEFHFRQGTISFGTPPLWMTDKTSWHGLQHIGADLLHFHNNGIKNGPIEFTATFTPADSGQSSKVVYSCNVVLATPYIPSAGYKRRTLGNAEFLMHGAGNVRTGAPSGLHSPPLRSAAYVTLLYGSGYEGGVVALARSLRSVKSMYPLIVLVPPDFNVPAMLDGKGNILVHRIPEEYYNILIQLPGHAPFMEADGYGSGIWLKLYAWRLTAYRRLVFVDADTVLLKNIDRLLRIPPSNPFVAAANMYFTATMMSFKPSLGTWNRMQSIFNIANKFRFPEQDFLNLYFAGAPLRLSNDFVCVVGLSIDKGWDSCAAIEFGTHRCLNRKLDGKSWKPWMPLEDLLMVRDDSCSDMEHHLAKLRRVFTLWSHAE